MNIICCLTENLDEISINIVLYRCYLNLLRKCKNDGSHNKHPRFSCRLVKNLKIKEAEINDLIFQNLIFKYNR
jgi:hypothetical protein